MIVYLARDILVFVKCIASMENLALPSILIESTDSMISLSLPKVYNVGTLFGHFQAPYMS